MDKKENNDQGCINCGGTGLDPKKFNTCPRCGATIRMHDYEIRVEGDVAEEVKEVTSHLIGKLKAKSKSKSLIKTAVMGFFRKKVKCKRFYEVQTRSIDLRGLKAGLPDKFDLGLGSFKLDTKFHDASEELKKLDLLQYGLCNDINGITNSDQRDKQLEKIIEAKTRMFEIILDIRNRTDGDGQVKHFNYLTKDDLVNLILNFNSDAFTTPFRLEESLISYQNRIFHVSDLIGGKLGDIHPNYKRHVLEIFSLLKALKKLSLDFTDHNYFIPWQPKSLAADVLRYFIVVKSNSLLTSLQVPDRIDNNKFIKDSYLVQDSTQYGINRISQVNKELQEVKTYFKEQGIEENLVDIYIKKLQVESNR